MSDPERKPVSDDELKKVAGGFAAVPLEVTGGDIDPAAPKSDRGEDAAGDHDTIEPGDEAHRDR